MKEEIIARRKFTSVFYFRLLIRIPANKELNAKKLRHPIYMLAGTDRKATSQTTHQMILAKGSIQNNLTLPSPRSPPLPSTASRPPNPSPRPPAPYTKSAPRSRSPAPPRPQARPRPGSPLRSPPRPAPRRSGTSGATRTFGRSRGSGLRWRRIRKTGGGSLGSRCFSPPASFHSPSSSRSGDGMKKKKEKKEGRTRLRGRC